MVIPRSPTRIEITVRTITGVASEAVRSMSRPLDCRNTSTQTPTIGGALVSSHISSSRDSTPGAVSRPSWVAVMAAVIGRMGRRMSSTETPVAVAAPKSTETPISHAATAPPSRLTTNRAIPLTAQMAVSSADWRRSRARTKNRSRGAGMSPVVNHRRRCSTTMWAYSTTATVLSTARTTAVTTVSLAKTVSARATMPWRNGRINAVSSTAATSCARTNAVA